MASMTMRSEQTHSLDQDRRAAVDLWRPSPGERPLRLLAEAMRRRRQSERPSWI
jgi:hypothetical protein